jgi:hypothetical protein
VCTWIMDQLRIKILMLYYGSEKKKKKEICSLPSFYLKSVCFVGLMTRTKVMNEK